MLNCQWKISLNWFGHSVVVTLLTSSFLSFNFGNQPVQAEPSAYCQQSSTAIAQKNQLRQAALTGDRQSESAYRTILAQQADALQLCRRQTWPQTQAIWLRLYPCDIRPGVIDKIFDDIVNRGYNQVYVESFYDSQVLLPAADNPTNWISVLRIPGEEKTDLLATAIQKGHDRGLKVYAWLYSLNFGYSYAQRPDRQNVLARNAQNQTSLDISTDVELDIKGGANQSDNAFVDPYHPQARADYNNMINAILQRRPDGVLFDYIRFPRQVGGASVATNVKDLWVYGEAAQNTLYQRALNHKGLELIRRFLKQGFVTIDDITRVDKLFPKEGEPLWQGRNPTLTASLAPAIQRQPQIQLELWELSVAHAMQGVIDFLNQAIQPVEQQGIPAGAVFFPEGNQVIRQGFDSRLQPWERFPSSIEWHPMVYGICGDSSCIISELQRVLNYAPPGTNVMPALAGVWGQSLKNRPSLETQMQDIHRAAPQVNGVSHFAYSWQEPDFDNDRKFCQVK